MTSVEKMEHSGTAWRLQGIMDCYNRRQVSDEEFQAMQNLKEDNRRLAGRTIATYAMAVLDLIGVEPYTGDDLDTKELILGLKATP